MSSAEALVSWVSGIGLAGGFGVAMFSLEHMRQRVNRRLHPDLRIGYGFRPNIGRSFGEAMFKWNILQTSLEVVRQHGEYYPASGLRKSFAFALVGMMLAFFGLLLSPLL
jgi:hypothetical protein